MRSSTVRLSICLVQLLVGVGFLHSEEGNPLHDLTDFSKRFPPKPESILPPVKQAPLEPRRAEEAPSDSATRLRADSHDPFFFRSNDGQFSVRFLGLIQTDYRTEVRGPDSTTLDTFQVRRGRLGAEAVVLDHFLFHVVGEFGQGQVRLLNGYGEIQINDALRLRAGRFRQPFGVELIAITNRRAPFLERSMLDFVGPNRDIGAMIYGNQLLEDRLDFAVSISNGNQNSDLDGDDRKELVGRLAIRPFNSANGPTDLRRFGVGLSLSTDVNQTPINQPAVRTPFGVTWFQFHSGVRLDGLRNRIGPEATYFNGGFGLAAQYLYQTAEYRPATDGKATPWRVTVPFNGFFILASYLLTGEERTEYDQWIDPVRPFIPGKAQTGYGAFEIVARVERSQFDRVVFASGVSRLVDPSLYSSAANVSSVGMNWYLNRFTRFSTHYEQAWFDNPVRLATGSRGLRSNSGSLLVRLQITF